MRVNRLLHLTIAANILLVLTVLAYLIAAKPADWIRDYGIGATGATLKAVTAKTGGIPTSSIAEETAPEVAGKEATGLEESFQTPSIMAPLAHAASEPSSTPPQNEADSNTNGARSNEISWNPVERGRNLANQITQVDSSAPGNSVSFDGQRIAIESTEHDSNGTGHDLNLVITPDPAESSSIPQVRKIMSSNRSFAAVRRQLGFTYEEELFRAKWGWEAFNQMQKVAREVASGKQ